MDKRRDKDEYTEERNVWHIIVEKLPKSIRLSDLKLGNVDRINGQKEEIYEPIKVSDRIYQNQEEKMSSSKIDEYKELAMKCYENAGKKNLFFCNDDEKWKIYKENKSWREQYKDIDYVEVSNWGRVRFKMKNGHSVIQKQVDDDTKKGYLRIDGNYSEFPVVYQMVAETWLIKDGNQDISLGKWHVHHISNNGYDNRPENLIWLRSTLHLGFVHKG